MRNDTYSPFYLNAATRVNDQQEFAAVYYRPTNVEKPRPTFL